MLKEDIIKKGSMIHNSKYDYSRIPDKFNSKDKLIILCPDHGEFLQTYNNHINNAFGCKLCRTPGTKLKPVTRLDELQEIFTIKIIDVLDDLDNTTIVFENGRTVTRNRRSYTKYKNVLLQHTATELAQLSISNKELQYIIATILGRETSEFNEEYIKVRGSITHDDKYDYDAIKYSNCKTKVLITCPKHGVFEQRLEEHLNLGMGCIKCGNTASKLEDKLYEFLTLNNIEVVRNDRNILKGSGKNGSNLELDLVLPEYKIAIETHGNRWHCEKFQKDNNRHYQKHVLCIDRGYRLLQFFEDEINTKLDIVKNIILSKLGKSNKIYARNTIVQEISYSESSSFLSKVHLQGSVKAKVHLGLFHQGNLVAVACFSNHVSNRGTSDDGITSELVRFASIGTVVGGLSKLIKNYIKTNTHIKTILSYSDNRISLGEAYQTIGFAKVRQVRPTYYYINLNDKSLTRLDKRKLQISRQAKLFNNFNVNLNEVENAANNGYYRLFDCGKILWSLNV